MNRKTWIMISLAALCLVALLAPLPWANRDRVWLALEDAAHFPLFVVLGSALWLSLQRLPRTKRNVWTVGLGCVLAIGVELAQKFTGRDPSVSDAAISCLGAASAVLLLDSLKEPFSGRRQRSRIGAFLLFVVAMSPLLTVVVDRERAASDFPLLASFERRPEWGRWDFRDMQVTRHRAHATAGAFAARLEVSAQPGPYPAMFMTDAIGSWEGYSQLCFDVFLAGDEALVLWLRADDNEDYLRYADRAQMDVLLQPGANHLCVNLDEFLRTPSLRALRRDHLTRWGLFLNEPSGGEVFFVDNIRLVR